MSNERINNEVTEDDSKNERSAFLEAHSSAECAIVHYDSRAFPTTTWVTFPEAKCRWNLPFVYSSLECKSETDGLIFEYNKKGTHYTGDFRRGGMQALTKELGIPAMFISMQKSVDGRKYSSWCAYYPEDGSALIEWESEIVNNQQALLKPKNSIQTNTLPTRVHIPNLPYMFERAGVDALDLFKPEIVDGRVNNIGVRQKNMSFPPLEVREGLTRLFRSASGDDGLVALGKSIDVPGSFVGKFAKTLDTIGFDVRASDILPEYVKGLQELGLNAKQYWAERLPKMKEQKFATVAFELYPLYDAETIYLAMLREMIRSQHGLVFVGKKDCCLEKYCTNVNKDHNEYYPEIDAYRAFGEAYGLGIHVVDTDSLRFVSSENPNDSQRAKMLTDLKLLYTLRRVVNHGSQVGNQLEKAGNEGLNRRFAFSLNTEALSQRIGVSTDEIIESLSRLESMHKGHIHEFMEELHAIERVNGGPMNVLEIIEI